MKPEDQYYHDLKKEADFWGKMAEIRAKQGVPDTMDYRLATKGRIRRREVGWGDVIQDRNLELKTPFGKAKKAFLDELKKYDGRSVFDLGCGAGWLALESARCGARVSAIDCSLQGIQVARQYHAGLPEESYCKINWIVGDMNNIPISGQNKFDLITAWDALHHVKEIDNLLKKLSDALKPEGVLMVSERVQGGRTSTTQKMGAVAKTVVNLLFPMVIDYSARARQFREIITLAVGKLLRTNRKKIGRPTPGTQMNEVLSPFEDTSGAEIIKSIHRHFRVERYAEYRAFSDDVERSAYFGERFDTLRKITVLGVSWIDYLITGTKILPGQIVFLKCSKKA